MKEIISPYSAIPSAMATKIMDLPKMLPSSLMAPSAALAAAGYGDTAARYRKDRLPRPAAM